MNGLIAGAYAPSRTFNAPATLPTVTAELVPGETTVPPGSPRRSSRSVHPRQGPQPHLRDEVIQKIEAGNVSLDTKSSLIQSTQALFGVKGEFKLGPLTLSSVVSQKKSKQEEKTFSQGVQEQNFQIQVWDYSDSHYLIDTLYKTSFLEVYGDSTGTNSFSTFVNENRLKITGDNFEVWMQCDVTESRKRFAVGKVMLAARPSTGYDTSVTTPEVIIGDKFAGYFRKLDPTEYYYNEYAGYINLKISVTTNMHVGVVYENAGFRGEILKTNGVFILHFL